MKKLISFIALLLFPVATHAAVVSGKDVYEIGLNNIDRTWDNITITAQSDSDITTEYGITIMLEKGIKAIWDPNITSVTATGPAVDNGKVASEITLNHIPEEQAINIPILENLSTYESFTISGLRLFSYKDGYQRRNFLIDLNGDFTNDLFDINGYWINADNESSDITAPFPPTNLAHSIANGDLMLTWVNPYDWDYRGMNIAKWERSGADYSLINATYNFVDLDQFPTFTDTSYNASVDTKYVLTAKDDRFYSDPAEIEILVEPEVPTETPKTAETIDLEESFDYYALRHAIKCKDQSKSECRWAKVHLIYAQEKLNRSEGDISLSERDLYLIGKRLRWPEKRYLERCIEPETPHKTCSFLKKSIDRAKYFLDQQ